MAGLSVQPDPNNPTVALKTNAGAFSVGQSDMTANGRMACPGSGSTLVPLWTVPSGKTFYLTDVQLSTVTTNEVDVQIAYLLGSVTVPIFRASILNTAPCTAIGIESQPDAPAGSTVMIILPTVSGTPSVDFTLGGFTQ